ncbi:MAG: AMP-binding protein [Oscillospiraceae bacterium]|nr:AMP-binding protein [Oscillospiraceae bacterium]
MRRSRLDALICEQEHLETLTREEIETVQLEKLNRLLLREKKRVGFYRNLPDHLNQLSDLASLPFTTEEDLSHNASSLLLTSQGDISRILSDATSGTTGLPKRVFYTDRDLENTVRLYMAGLGELIFPGNTVMICFPFSGPNGLGELIADAITRLGARPLKLGTACSYGELLSVLEAEQPEAYVGMPVPLLGLLRVCGRKSLRRALVSGDACPEIVTHSCEELLGTKLFPHYGSREMGMAGAITCPAHSGMHLRENHIIVEIISPEGKPLPLGETGELVITTIGMEALPLIRYRTGDFTRILPSPCPCGSETFRLDRVWRESPPLSMPRLDELIFSVPDVVDYRAEKKGELILLTILTTKNADAKLVASAVEALFPNLQVSVSARTVSLHDTALYRGKRVLLPL